MISFVFPNDFPMNSYWLGRVRMIGGPSQDEQARMWYAAQVLDMVGKDACDLVAPAEIAIHSFWKIGITRIGGLSVSYALLTLLPQFVWLNRRFGGARTQEV